MIKQLKKVGNSNAIILDKAIMELVGLEENGQVQLTVDHGSVILTPAKPHMVDEKRFQEAKKYIFKKRHEVLRRLAK
jgi:antitoxin component of MazEF toxin-antitoxin module